MHPITLRLRLRESKNERWNLDQCGIGDVDTPKVREYQARSRWGGLAYLLEVYQEGAKASELREQFQGL